MPLLRWLVPGLISTIGMAADGPPPGADEIMRRVAENQDRALQQREEFLYKQRVTIATRRGGGKLVRQETAEYLITPTRAGFAKNLQNLDGRYWEKGNYIQFHGEPAPKNDGVDAELIKDFRNDLLNEKTRDGLARDLFPLTAEEQKRLQFELAGDTTIEGRKAYRIAFRPRDKSELAWAGEALVDAEEFQPVTVFTRLSRKIPIAVRTLLGTDLPGVGFHVRYQRLEKDTWFPASFGTEFRLRVLFFLNREITIASESTGFRRTHVDSRIDFTSPHQ